MQMMTLREVCDEFGVSRLAVQGYEKAGLRKIDREICRLIGEK